MNKRKAKKLRKKEKMAAEKAGFVINKNDFFWVLYNEMQNDEKVKRNKQEETK